MIEKLGDSFDDVKTESWMDYQKINLHDQKRWRYEEGDGAITVHK